MPSSLFYIGDGLAMGKSGHHGGGAGAISRHLKVLLPSFSSSSGKLRISDELARRWDGDVVGSGVVVAPLVSPFGKVWRVEVGRDAEGAFLGRGWPEFAAAHGFGDGWFLVLRHDEAAGVLTVKAFDATCCIREFGRPLIGDSVAANDGGSGGSRRPQFIKVLLPPSMEKMLIPPRFVRKYITEPETGSLTAVVLFLSPLSKFCRVTVDKDQSGNDVFFSGGWSRFLASNGIAEYDVLLLRYEGNMVFTVKVFGPDGCQKGCKQSDETGSGDTKTEEQDPPSSRKKPKGMAKKPADGGENSKRPRKCAAASSNYLLPLTNTVYDIGPPSWMKREINKHTLLNHLRVAGSFCKAIGLQKTSEITIRKKNTDEGHGLRSWQVRVMVYGKRSCGHLTRGWRRFCTDNGIEEGDVCTFSIVETTLWHVDITRRRG